MSKKVLSVENVSKRFWIGESQDRGARHLVENFLRHPLSLFKKMQRKEFWALKNLNFDVEEGQTLGVVGRNGAGKSTLLKLLSRITPPTSGTITINGRVGSLLEVGTGFHPELTGRENIFLNGALLGMKRAEIIQKFDAIVEFSEIAEFIDTPVKRYSSGMYVRLAFSIAAHLQTEVLIVDEILAVGDSRFQKKCLEKMNELGRGGRTILFVSHNLSLIQNVCSHALLLENGRQIDFGKTADILHQYQKNSTGAEGLDGVDLLSIARARGRPSVLSRAKLALPKGAIQAKIGDEIILEVDAILPPEVRQDINLIARVTTDLGSTLFTLSSLFQHGPVTNVPEELKTRCGFTLPALREGVYSISLELYSRETLIDEMPNILILEVSGTDFFGHGYHIPPSHGPMLVAARWDI